MLLVTGERELPDTRGRKFSLDCVPEESSGPHGLSLDRLPAGLASNYVHISEIHQELFSLVAGLNSKIVDALSREETGITEACTSKLLSMQKELNLLRCAYEGTKQPQAPGTFQQSVERLTQEIADRNAQCDRLKREMRELTLKNEQLTNENSACEARLRKAARENRRLLLQLRKLEHAGDKVGVQRGYICAEDKKDIAELEHTISAAVGAGEDSDYLNDGKPSRTQTIARCEQYVKTALTKQTEIVGSIKRQLSAERRQNRRLRLLHADAVAYPRSELETLFLECVEEVRRTHAGKKETTDLGPDDKAKVMELFMRNDRLLQALYDVMFREKLPALGAKEGDLSAVFLGEKTSGNLTLDLGYDSTPEPRKKAKSRVEFSRHRLTAGGRMTPSCNATSPAEMRVRKKVYGVPSHLIRRDLSATSAVALAAKEGV